MDGRRRQWYALDAYLSWGKFGDRLGKEFGRDGLFAWIAYLAACKRNPVQGEFTYTDEALGLVTLSPFLADPPVEFTLGRFFSFTGRAKQTKRAQAGSLTTVTCINWDEWQHPTLTRLRRTTASEREFVPVPNGKGEVARIVETLAPLGTIKPEQVARLIAGFPEVDHYKEAVALQDWALSRGIETKDVGARYRNWLKKAKPNGTDPDPYEDG